MDKSPVESKTFSSQGADSNIFSFVSHTVFVATTHFAMVVWKQPWTVYK